MVKKTLLPELVISKAPLRISFAGGGTDLEEYYRIDYEWLKLMVIYGMLIFMSISILILHTWEIAYFNRLIIKFIYLGIFMGLGMYFKIITKSNLLLIFRTKKTVMVQS